MGFDFGTCSYLDNYCFDGLMLPFTITKLMYEKLAETEMKSRSWTWDMGLVGNLFCRSSFHLAGKAGPNDLGNYLLPSSFVVLDCELGGDTFGVSSLLILLQP